MGDRPVVPGLPLEGLDQVPERRAVLLDITVTLTVLSTTILMVTVLPRQSYAGVRSRESADARFLYGRRYQEILGNMHNLFGDTEAVDVSCSLTVVSKWNCLTKAIPWRHAAICTARSENAVNSVP